MEIEREVFEMLPDWAGKFISMTIYDERLIVLCEYGVFQLGSNRDILQPVRINTVHLDIKVEAA